MIDISNSFFFLKRSIMPISWFVVCSASNQNRKEDLGDFNNIGREHYVVLIFQDTPPSMNEIAVSLKNDTTNASLTSRGPKEKTVGFSSFKEKMDFLKKETHVVGIKSAVLSDPTPDLTEAALRGQRDALHREATRTRIFRAFSVNTRLTEEEVIALISKDFPSRTITRLSLDKFYDQETKTQTNIRNGHVTFWLQGPIEKFPDCHKELGRCAVYQEKGPFTAETKQKSKERSQKMMAKTTPTFSSGSTSKFSDPSTQRQADPNPTLPSELEGKKESQISSNQSSTPNPNKKVDTIPISNEDTPNPTPQNNQDRDPMESEDSSPAPPKETNPQDVSSFTPQTNKRAHSETTETPSPKDRKEIRALNPSQDQPEQLQKKNIDGKEDVAEYGKDAISKNEAMFEDEERNRKLKGKGKIETGSGSALADQFD